MGEVEERGRSITGTRGVRRIDVRGGDLVLIHLDNMITRMITVVVVDTRHNLIFVNSISLVKYSILYLTQKKL